MKLLSIISFVALVALARADECPAPEDAQHTRYCALDSYGEVSLRQLSSEEYAVESAFTSLFAPNSLYPERNGVFYDCECAPKCGLDAEDRYYNPIYKFAQFGLDDPAFSYFHDDALHYCIAVPKRALDSELYFVDADGEAVALFHCDSTYGMEEEDECSGWTKRAASDGYRHSCYDTFCVDAPWAELTPYYKQHTDEHYRVTYNGVVASKCSYGQEVCHDHGCTAVTPLTYVAPNLFNVSTTIHVSAHLGDIRVYSPAVVVAYETEHSTVFSEFEWGFDNSVDVVAQIYFSTRVQAPLFVSLEGYSASDFSGSLDLFQFELSELCYERPSGYKLDGNDAGCKQEWLITMVPEFDDCMIDTVLDLKFSFDCDPAFVAERGECPFTRGVDSNELSFQFEYATDDWCDVLEIDIAPPVAKMDSYVDDSCSLADDFLITERSFFEVSVKSNEYLTVTGTNLIGLHVGTTCGEGYANAGWFVYEGDFTYMASLINLEVSDYPATTCHFKSADETVRFSFDLDSEFFRPPAKDSCKYVVWAVLELEYAGFDDKQLLSVELTEDPVFGDGSPINRGSMKLEGSYSSDNPSALSSASALSLSAATVVAMAVPALL